MFITFLESQKSKTKNQPIWLLMSFLFLVLVDGWMLLALFSLVSREVAKAHLSTLRALISS